MYDDFQVVYCETYDVKCNDAHIRFLIVYHCVDLWAKTIIMLFAILDRKHNIKIVSVVVIAFLNSTEALSMRR